MGKETEKWMNAYSLGRFYLIVGITTSFIVIFIATALLQFKDRVYQREYELQMEAMQDLAAQGSAVLEERLDGYLNMLTAIAPLFKEGELWAEERMDSLRELIQTPGIDFQRMGVSDQKGQAMMTNGSIVDISSAEYFEAALRKESVISERHTSRLIHDQVFMASVPVLDEKEKVRGVLFAIIEVERFRIFEETSLDDLKHYIKVVDRNGDYLVNTAENPMKVQDDNVFALLDQLQSSTDAGQVRECVEAGEEILLQVNDGEKDYVTYFTPLQNYEWYVVTVTERQGILDRVEYLLGRDIYFLMAEIGLACVLICAGIVWVLWRDKKRTERDYSQLQIDSKMIRTAFSCTNSVIFIYNGETDVLATINQKSGVISLPEKLEHASENLIQLLPERHKTRSQVAEIFKRLASMEEEEDFALSLEEDGRLKSYLVHVKAIAGDDHRIVRNVGVLEDITERLNLQERAETDFLTGIDNRRSAMEKIEQILKERPEEGRLHAFVILDLDHFKELNDTLGHSKGDQALREVAFILSDHFRQNDVISRLAGDEFVVLVRNISGDAIDKKLKNLLQKLNITYRENGKSITLTASAGIANAPYDGADFEALYHKADQALYRAKKKGRNTYCSYVSE